MGGWRKWYLLDVVEPPHLHTLTHHSYGCLSRICNMKPVNIQSNSPPLVYIACLPLQGGLYPQTASQNQPSLKRLLPDILSQRRGKLTKSATNPTETHSYWLQTQICLSVKQSPQRVGMWSWSWCICPFAAKDLERGMGGFSTGKGGHCCLEEWGMGAGEEPANVSSKFSPLQPPCWILETAG